MGTLIKPNWQRTVIAYASATFTCNIDASLPLDVMEQKIKDHIRNKIQEPGVSKLNIQIRSFTPDCWLEKINEGHG